MKFLHRNNAPYNTVIPEFCLPLYIHIDYNQSVGQARTDGSVRYICQRIQKI